jgi:TatA/E family protein of Tat protein translocase
LIVILAVALIVFGRGRLAEIGGQLGRGVHEFRDSMEGKGSAAPEPLSAT